MNKLHEILRDPECHRNIVAVAAATCVVLFMFCAMSFGFVWLGHDEAIKGKYYALASKNELSAERLAKLEQRVTDNAVAQAMNNIGLFDASKILILLKVAELKRSIMPSAFKGIPKEKNHGKAKATSL